MGSDRHPGGPDGPLDIATCAQQTFPGRAPTDRRGAGSAMPVVAPARRAGDRTPGTADRTPVPSRARILSVCPLLPAGFHRAYPVSGPSRSRFANRLRGDVRTILGALLGASGRHRPQRDGRIRQDTYGHPGGLMGCRYILLLGERVTWSQDGCSDIAHRLLAMGLQERHASAGARLFAAPGTPTLRL